MAFCDLFLFCLLTFSMNTTFYKCSRDLNYKTFFFLYTIWALENGASHKTGQGTTEESDVESLDFHV